MKKTSKLFGIIVSLAVIGVFMVTCDEPAKDKEENKEGYAFELISGNTEYSISLGKAKATGEIKLPASYKKLPVTAIADNAFASCVNMTGITIPNKVTRIGDKAFDGCTSLLKVTFTSTIPESGFSSVNSFPGDLRGKYLAEGIRTYSRTSGSGTIWTGTPPDIPSGVTAIAESFSSIVVSWSSVTGATGYKIYRSTNAADTFTEVGTSVTTSFTDTGLTASTTCYYKVAATNSGGAGTQSNAVNAATESGIPEGITAIATSSSSITISWSSVTGATGYKIYRNTSAAGTFTEIGTSVITSFTDTYASTTYYYKVAATNNGGIGLQSSAVNALPLITIHTHPVSTTKNVGNISGSLSVSASVTQEATLSYKWYSNITPSNIGGNIINGATSSSYTIPTNLTAGAYYYFVEISATGGAASVRSNVAIVYVLLPPITSSSGISMVYIPAGTFTMGSPTSEANRDGDETQHQVTISKGFYMGKYEVTQEQYQAVMGINPSFFNRESGREPAAGEIQSRRPVENVTWYDAVEFCNKLSAAEGLTSVYTISGRTPASGYPITSAAVTANWNANGYRLPTEAEWEYACRAGTTTVYYTGDTISDNTGWYTSNSNNRSHEVGLKPPNAWGLHDMHGNVCEWCWDWYGSYASGAQTDPRGAASDYDRVRRGGSWASDAQRLRSAYRLNNGPSNRYEIIGFRVVRP